MAHECPFNGNHSPLTNADDLSFLEDGVCPLCAHDFMGEPGQTVCIECGHSFDNQSEGDEVSIRVIPLDNGK